VAQVWCSADGVSWRKITRDGFGRGAWNFSVRAMEPFADRVYAGTGVECGGVAEVYRSDGDDRWERVVGDGFGRRTNNIVYAMAVYEDQLYAGTANVLRGAGVYRTRDGRAWEPVAEGGFGQRANHYVCDLRVYQETPASRPKLVATTGWNPGGAGVWIYDGQRWARFAPRAFGTRRNIDIAAAGQFDGDFYAGTWKTWWPWPAANGAELWRYDGRTSRWERETTDGFGNPHNVAIRVIHPSPDALYVTVRNRKTGAEIWKGVRP
jgi:hypothetical protein